MSNKNEEDIKNVDSHDEDQIEDNQENNSCESEQEQQEPTHDEIVQKLESEVDSLKDKYARVHADFENVKKRLEKEKATALEYANEKFAKDMIPVLDSLEMALGSANKDESGAEHFESIKEGIELTLKQFMSALDKHGVTKVEHDEPFDPNIHNAVQSVDSEDVNSGEIVQTFQTGYRYKERPLREAMVVVAN